MKKTLAIIMACAIALAATTAGALITTSFRGEPAIAAGEELKMDTLTVQGTANISVKPDIAYVTLGAYTENKDAKTAQSDNAKTMAEIIKAVKNTGVAEKDIQTAQYYVNPVYDYSENKQNLTGYSVTNSVKITVRDINKVGDVIDAAAGAGSNISNGVSFDLSDNSKAYNQALALAALDAKSKADTLANATSRTIDSSFEIVESGTHTAAVYESREKTAAAGMMMDMGAALQTGELTINAAVVITYKLK